MLQKLYTPRRFQSQFYQEKWFIFQNKNSWRKNTYTVEQGCHASALYTFSIWIYSDILPNKHIKYKKIRCHLINYLTHFNYLNILLVAYSDPHCVNIKIETKSWDDVKADVTLCLFRWRRQRPEILWKPKKKMSRTVFILNFSKRVEHEEDLANDNNNIYPHFLSLSFSLSLSLSLSSSPFFLFLLS